VLTINFHNTDSTNILLNLAVNLTLLTTIGLAALFDIKERRIPNWVILFGLIAGLVLGAFRGGTHFIFNVSGFFAGILALMIPFAFGWMGAGDVKMFAAMGALIGYKPLPRVFFYSCLVAGVIALIAMGLGQARQISFKNFWNDCKFMFLTLGIRLPNNKRIDSGSYSVPWGVAIGAGTIMAYYVDPSGSWAGF
jgi:prepilin peptidase CpaA